MDEATALPSQFLARSFGVQGLCGHASKLAKRFLEQRGFVWTGCSDFLRGTVRIHNHRMEKGVSAWLALFVGLTPATAHTQDAPDMRLEAMTAEVGIEVEGVVSGRWSLDLKQYPSSITLPVRKSDESVICFTNEDRRTCANFFPGQARTLEVSFAGGKIASVIRARRDTPPASFDPAYQAAHRGRTFVEIPEVYELVNIVIAMTPYAQADRDLVYHESAYYDKVQEYFEKHVNHPLIGRIDAMLRLSRSDYFPLKMNGYAFVFDNKGSILRSPVYDRTGFTGSYDNALLPFIDELEDFARISNFREFYRQHEDLYAEQIRYFEGEAQVSRITAWLTERFPAVEPYDGVKVIFSPLVAYNQSLTTIEADGYRELQPHVNYPYRANPGLSADGAAVERSVILFTEMNHGYIGPTTARFRERIDAVLADRTRWADDRRAAGNYVGAEALFNEYLNWALVSLYIHDLMSAEDFAIAHAAMVDNLQNGRGFRRFAEFDAELLRLYIARQSGQGVEELYPSILSWMERQ